MKIDDARNQDSSDTLVRDRVLFIWHICKSILIEIVYLHAVKIDTRNKILENTHI